MRADDELKSEKRKEFSGGDNLSKLQRRMYSRERKGFLPWRRRRPQPMPKPLAPDDWQYDAQQDVPETEVKERGTLPGGNKTSNGATWVRFIFVGSIIFFVIAILGAVAYLFFTTAKVQTKAAVKLSVEGVTSISSGELVELQVLVVNDNDKPLELSDLIIEYPDGTVSPVDFSAPMLGERIPLGKIEPHSARRGALRAVIFGTNGSTTKIKVELQYRLKGSSVLHSRTTEYGILISSDAMSITIDGDSELVPGQTTPMAISIKSYATTILNGVYVDAMVPFGVSIVESSPDSVDSVSAGDADERWILGTLQPGEERTIYLSVSADGQVGDERHLQFLAGAGLIQAADGVSIDDKNKTVLAQKQHTIKVERPFLATSLSYGGVNLNDAVAYSGKEMLITLKWHNNLQVPVTDAAIKVELGGTALNRAGVKVDRYGFYRSVDNLLLWDYKTSKEKMKTIAPGESGEFTFRLRPLNRTTLEKIQKPELTFIVHVTGKRLSESSVPEVLVADASYTTKVATDVLFDAYALFNSSPFSAVGSMPPKVEYETQYGVTWTVANTTSDITDTVVTAELPHYVRWVGLTTPADEQIIYNKVDHTLEWDLGTVEAGVGVGATPPRSVSFALGLVPSISQLGGTPSLLFNQVLSATDSYTGVEMVVPGPMVTTKLDREPGFNNNNASVVK